MHTDMPKGEVQPLHLLSFNESLNMKLKDAGSPFSLARAAHGTVI